MGAKSRCKGWWAWLLVLAIFGLVVGAVVLAVVKKVKKNSGGDDGAVPGPPGAITQKYSDALKLAVQFFDVQKSGQLVDNKISWRGDSGLKDGSDVKLDLSKGMYDAGDQMKFGFPMAYTATVLSWTILEYGDQMDAVNQLQTAQASLKWITDFLVNAHPKDNVLYVQVGDPKKDHACWYRPEDMTESRPVTQVNTSAPGTDVAAERWFSRRQLPQFSSSFSCPLCRCRALAAVVLVLRVWIMSMDPVLAWRRAEGGGGETIWWSKEDVEWVKDQIRVNGLRMQDNVLRKGINPRTRAQRLEDLSQYKLPDQGLLHKRPLIVKGDNMDLSRFGSDVVYDLIYASAVFLHMPDKLVWVGLERLTNKLKPYDGRIFVSHNIKFCSQLGGDECTKQLTSLDLEYVGKHTHASLLFNHYEI